MVELLLNNNLEVFMNEHVQILSNGAANPPFLVAPEILDPPQRMTTNSTLIADTGTRLVTRDELKLIVAPEPTRTFRPVSHHDLVQAIITSLGYRHLHVVADEYAVSNDGLRMFGLMEVDAEWSGLRFAIGLRNGNNRMMRLAITVGYRVFCCSNMMFKGEYFPLIARHSGQLDLIEQVSVAVDRIQRNFEPLTRQIESWCARQLTSDEARLILYKAFMEKGIDAPIKLLKEAHKHYFQPQYEEFNARTLFSLSNALTSSFKLLDPLKKYPVTAKLAGFLTQFE